MAEIDLDDLSTPEHGYTVNDEDPDDPALCDQDGKPIDTWREGSRIEATVSGSMRYLP
jgi:polyphosphate kinase